MFDHIHFNIADSTVPITNIEMLQRELQQKVPYSDVSQLLSAFRFFEKCQFCIDGRSFTLPIRPNTTFAREKLFYMQSFSILDASPHFFTKRSDMDSYMFLFTYGGKGEFRYNGCELSLEKGEGVFVNCREEHFYRTSGEHWYHSVLHFSGSVADYFYQEFNSKGNVKFIQPLTGFYQSQLEKLLEIYQSISSYREILISNILENILVDFLRQTQRYNDEISNLPESIKYLVRYIDNNYMKPLSLDYLAEFSNMSKFHMCKLFKKYMKFTPNEYIIWHRIENAKSLLRSTDISASQIGKMVGIPDENYFYRIFKTRVGVTPITFRKE